MTDLLSDEFLAGLKTSLDCTEIELLEREEISGIAPHITDTLKAARAFHALAPLLREWVESGNKAPNMLIDLNNDSGTIWTIDGVQTGPEEWEPVQVHLGDIDSDLGDFLVKSANTATKIKDILGGV